MAQMNHVKSRWNGQKEVGPILTFGKAGDRAVLFLFSLADPYLSGIEEPSTKRLVVGWSPTGSAKLISSTSSANCWQSLASGKSQRQGYHTHCHFGTVARRKQGQNDLPQLPGEDGESRILWEE